MDVLELSRLQFAVTTVYHFFFVPLTLGLSILVAIMNTLYVRTNDERYKQMTKFWGKLFLINFAMGVVTGIVQEFQFGMNWSEYSRFVGDIFGAPLAVEALMAFFLESTFLGLWIFGWDKLPKKVHLATIWLAAIGANISAFWILVANSFMQNPVGYAVVDGRATMTDFLALITNPNVLLQYPHVVFGGFTTGAFFVLGVSAFHLLRHRRQTAANTWMFNRSFNIALVFGLFAIIGTMIAGHAQGQNMARYQPMKLAAAEGLWHDEDPAALSMFQIGDEQARNSIINLRIPSLLSFLTYDTPNGLVRGINSLNAEYVERFSGRYDEAYAAQHGLSQIDYVPPAIWLTYWSFRAMVGAGVAMFLLILAGLWFRFRGTILQRAFYLRVIVLAIVLPYLANTTGWLLTEFGRQPWIVFGEMRIEEAVSPNVTAAMLWITLLGFTLVYGVLMVVDLWLLWKYGSAGITPALPEEAAEPAPQPTPVVSY